MTRPRTGFAFLDAGLDSDGGTGEVLAFAHRGGALHPDLPGLENTMTSFRHAVALGYRYLETDVHVTRDGVLLACHDPGLDRVAGSGGRIRDMTYEEVAEVAVGGHEVVPRFADLLEDLPEARFNVDLKSPGSVAALARLVDLTGSHDRLCVGSFTGRWVSGFRRLVSRPVATAVTPAGVVAARFAPGPAYRRLTRAQGPALQVPHRRGPVVVATPALLERAHATGRVVHVWTVDDPAEMHHLLDLGVDGLMTDRTDLLRAVLTERGLWMEAS